MLLNMNVSAICTELLIFLKPNLIGWYIIISCSILCKTWNVVFKVRVTMKVQNCIESLCTLYLLNHWSHGNQTRCANVLLQITKPSTTNWAYTDSKTLTYGITRWHTLCLFFLVAFEARSNKLSVLLKFTELSSFIPVSLTLTYFKILKIPATLKMPKWEWYLLGKCQSIWFSLNCICCYIHRQGHTQCNWKKMLDGFHAYEKEREREREKPTHLTLFFSQNTQAVYIKHFSLDKTELEHYGIIFKSCIFQPNWQRYNYSASKHFFRWNN